MPIADLTVSSSQAGVCTQGCLQLQAVCTEKNEEDVMKRTMAVAWRVAAVFVLVAAAGLASAQGLARTEIRVPDIPGYRTLKCDFHMHTVFSDGRVWPTVRVDELWRDGFDAFAITDHVESRPWKKDVSLDLNRAFEVAAPRAARYGLTIVRGAEITRKMPPGHLNAIFLKDENMLNVKEWRDALRIARKQGAFIFWNHPGWTGQQPDGVSRWYEEHDKLIKNDQMHGIEVVNGKSYYPLAHQWCLEKKLTLMATSDVHSPIDFDYSPGPATHRPATLVFAKNASARAIREALFARRTAVHSGEKLIGEAVYLKPLFEHSIRILDRTLTICGKGRRYIRIANASDVPFHLKRQAKVPGLSVPGRITVPAGKSVLISVRGTSKQPAGRCKVHLPYEVTNLLVKPDQGLRVELELDVHFLAEEKKSK